MKISNLGRKSLVQRQDSHTQEDGVNIKVIRMEAAGESDSLVASSGNMSSTNIIVDPQASEIVTIPDRAGMRHSLEVPSSNILPANIIVEPQSFEVVTIPGRAGMSAYDIWLDEGNEGTKEEFLNGLAKSVLSYKGTADTFADLPTTGNAVGDFWNIRDTGFNFVWDGEGWDQVSGLTDLSNYVDITTFESQLTQLQTEVDARDSELEDNIYDAFDEIYRIDDELAQLDARDSELEDDIYDAMDLLFSFEEDVEQLDFYINDLYFYMEDLYDIKQDKLVAGNNITIDEDNVISADDVFWDNIVDKPELYDKSEIDQIENDMHDEIWFSTWEMLENIDKKQDKLVAGNNIHINPDTNVISASVKRINWQDVQNKPKVYDKGEIEDIVDNKVSEVDIMIGSVSVYTEEGPFAGFRTIDGHTLQESDTILVVGNGSNNGIYIVNKDGVWQRIQKVEKFQVVSIDNGIVYGGSMQKKMEDGITKMVKKPERSAWRVLI